MVLVDSAEASPSSDQFHEASCVGSLVVPVRTLPPLQLRKVAARMPLLPQSGAWSQGTESFDGSWMVKSFDQVLPPSQHRRVSIEAGVTFGWREYIGDRGVAIGIDRYGASAPGEIVLEKLGITAAAVVEAVQRTA